MTHSRTTRLILTALVLAPALAACSSGSTTPTDSGSGASATLVPYTGGDEKIFTAVADPTPVPGTTFVLGYLDPYGAIPGLLAEQQAACAQAEKLGGSCIAKDANVSVQTQVSQLSELLAQGATAIAVSPLDPSALAPSLMEAKSKNVLVVGTEMPPDLTQPAVAGVSANVTQALDYGSWATMTEVAKAAPGAHVGLMGTASPNPLLRYLMDRQSYWATKMGLQIAGQVDAQQDNPSAWATAGGSLAQKYPQMTVLVTYNDNAALAASSAARASGRPDVKVADANGYSALATPALADGRMIATYSVPWAALGTAMANLAYNAQTGVALPATVGVKGMVVTKDNAGTITPVG